jgi:hypothetical protein
MKVLTTQKLNAHHCKEQIKKFFSRTRKMQSFCAAVTFLQLKLCNRLHNLYNCDIMDQPLSQTLEDLGYVYTIKGLRNKCF